MKNLTVTIGMDGNVLHHWKPVRYDITNRHEGETVIIVLENPAKKPETNSGAYCQKEEEDTPYVFRERVKIIKGFYRGQYAFCVKFYKEDSEILVAVSASSERVRLNLEQIEKAPQPQPFHEKLGERDLPDQCEESESKL